MRKQQQSGFTLIELMIVVAVVAILAAVAMPAFNGQMRKSRRAEAVAALQDWQLRLERWRVDHANFVTTTAQLPRPTHSYYDFSVTAATTTPNDYTISATPKTGSAQVGDSCGTLTLTRTASGVSKTPSGTSCW